MLLTKLDTSCENDTINNMDIGFGSITITDMGDCMFILFGNGFLDITDPVLKSPSLLIG